MQHTIRPTRPGIEACCVDTAVGSLVQRCRQTVSCQILTAATKQVLGGALYGAFNFFKHGVVCCHHLVDKRHAAH
jgi:hypothetical protein